MMPRHRREAAKRSPVLDARRKRRRQEWRHPYNPCPEACQRRPNCERCCPWHLQELLFRTHEEGEGFPHPRHCRHCPCWCAQRQACRRAEAARHWPAPCHWIPQAQRLPTRESEPEGEGCHKVPRQSCSMVARQQCSPKSSRQCHSEPKNVCKTVARQKCRMEPRQKCAEKLQKVIRKSFETKCFFSIFQPISISSIQN